MVAQQGAQRLLFDAGLLGVRKGFGFRDRAADPHAGQAAERADQERNAPAPGGHVGLGQGRRQDPAHRGGGQDADGGAEEDEAGIEAALVGRGHFRQEGRGRGILSAQGQALQQAGRGQQQRGGQADGGVGGGDGDDEGTARHHQNRQAQRGFAAVAVGKDAQHPTTHGAHEEAHGEDAEGGEQRRCFIAFRKELAGKEDGERGVDGPIEPLDRIAYTTGQNGAGAGYGRRAGGRGACPLLAAQGRGWAAHVVLR
ncbi:hypothetical protein D3C87_1331090 [compost metagenome]